MERPTPHLTENRPATTSNAMWTQIDDNCDTVSSSASESQILAMTFRSMGNAKLGEPAQAQQSARIARTSHCQIGLLQEMLKTAHMLALWCASGGCGGKVGMPCQLRTPTTACLGAWSILGLGQLARGSKQHSLGF